MFRYLRRCTANAITAVSFCTGIALAGVVRGFGVAVAGKIQPCVICLRVSYP